MGRDVIIILSSLFDHIVKIIIIDWIRLLPTHVIRPRVCWCHIGKKAFRSHKVHSLLANYATITNLNLSNNEAPEETIDVKTELRCNCVVSWVSMEFFCLLNLCVTFSETKQNMMKNKT